jgi:hypothetical protein
MLNLDLVIAQVIYGMANSVALLADGRHNFGDVLELLLAWVHIDIRQLGDKSLYETANYRSTNVRMRLQDREFEVHPPYSLYVAGL